MKSYTTEDTGETTSPTRAPKNFETIQSMLSMLGFSPELIQAGIAALSGKTPQSTWAQPTQEQPQPAQPQLQDEPLLTPQELCDRLKISMTSLWRMKPPYIKVGGRKRFCWTEILRYFESQSPEVTHG